MTHAIETQESPRSFVAIDSQVADWQSLIADINPNSIVLVLDSARDGLTQIVKAVRDCKSIHPQEL